MTEYVKSMRNAMQHYIGIWLLYLLPAIGITWPLVLCFRNEVPGHPWLATKIHVWQFWWTREALLRPEWSLGHTPLLYFPDGFNTLTEMGNFFVPLASVPFQMLFGLAGGYNAMVLGLFAAAGTAAYALCRRVVRSRAAAFVGGAAFAFLPYAWMKVFDAELEIAILLWIPLVFLQLERCLERPTVPRSLVLGALLFLAAMSSWYYGFFLGVSVVLAGVVVAAVRRRRGRFREAGTGRALAALGGAMVLYALLMFPLVRELQQTARVRDLDWRGEAREWDLSDKANPDLLEGIAPWQRAPSEARLRAAAREGIPYPFAVFPGVVALALATCGLVQRRRVSAPLWAAAIFWGVVSLGPWLKVAGHAGPVPLPLPGYALAAWSRGFAAITLHAYRAAAVPLLLVSVLAALGFEWLLKRTEVPTRRHRVLAGATAVLIAFGALDGAGIERPFRRTRLEVSPLYDRLRDAAGEGAVLNIPVSEVDQVAADYMLAQTRHGRPILTGRSYEPRLPGRWGSALDGLRYRDEGTGAPLPPDRMAAQVAHLSQRGVRFFVLHTRWLSEPRAAAIRPALEKECVRMGTDEAAGIEVFVARSSRTRFTMNTR